MNRVLSFEQSEVWLLYPSQSAARWQVRLFKATFFPMRIEVACTISNFSAMRTEVVAVAHPVEGPKEQVESFQTFFTVGCRYNEPGWEAYTESV